MPSAYEGTDIISYLQRKYIIRHRRIPYRDSDISLKTASNYDYNLSKKGGVVVSNKFLVVKKYIDQMDYYGLLASGAPSDEFDIETKEISARINDDHSALDIAVIIASVFNDYFDEHDDAAALARRRILCKRFSTKSRISRYQCA